MQHTYGIKKFLANVNSNPEKKKKKPDSEELGFSYKTWKIVIRAVF